MSNQGVEYEGVQDQRSSSQYLTKLETEECELQTMIDDTT